LLETEDASPHLRVVDSKTGASHRIDLPEEARDVSLHGEFPGYNPEFSAKTLRFRYESLKTPATIFDWDDARRELAVAKRTEVPAYDPASLETTRVRAPARDGTLIPISLVYPKGVKPDKTRPMLLTGYGAYGISNFAAFSPERLPLIERGVVVGVAHVRGGGEMGKKWHDQGRMAAKMNTFTDFIDCAEYLKKEGWVAEGRLGISGGSAGGLLMGAVTNMRPDLFRAVLAQMPFVDVINTMLDESLPLTVAEFEEWGNPKIKEQYDVMARYSPYDNVEKKAYPAMLVRTSYNDSQVMYWEPAKWVAKLRSAKTDDRPLVFKINMQPAGHAGQSGRYDRFHDQAFDDAFLLTELGAALPGALR
jgi:oligopeptidase B